MPRRLALDDRLPGLLAQQDSIITTPQAAAMGFSPDAIQRRVASGRWRRVLPGVLLASDAEPNRRQLLVAAHRWAGPDSLIDGPCACRWRDMTVAGFDPDRVNVLVSQTSGRRSRDFVIVRRSLHRPPSEGTDLLQYVDIATALIVSALRTDERRAAGMLAEALQREHVSEAQLVDAMSWAPPAGQPLLWAILRDLGIGVRSLPERDLSALVRTSRNVPEPLWNAWLRLPDGALVSPDALWVTAGLVHEVNGRRFHAWGEMFDSMQARHSAMTAAGLTVLHSSPRLISGSGATVLQHIERAFARCEGRGLPEGVELVGLTR